VTILGFDTSTAATSACVLRSDGEAFELIPEAAALTGPPGHARELMPAIATVSERAGVGLEGLEAIAVGTGPGTFTGLRIGIATARALAGTLAVPIHAVSSLAALAAGIDAPLRLAVIDARRGEVFAALFRGDEQLVAPFVAAPEEVVPRLGVPATAVTAAGDGSLRFRRVFEAAGVTVDGDGSRTHVVRALHVCRLGAHVSSTSREAVVPTYLRAPDAQPTT
jgi:tRNA threonylcarbamoyladenosine biosynthesis protein TsaB